MYWSVSNIKYILAIRALFAVSNEIKCKDLANLLGDSSVDFYEISKSLSRDGIIEMAPNFRIQLTRYGYELAEEVHRKYLITYDFLVNRIHTNPTVAHDDAIAFLSIVPSENIDNLAKCSTS